MKRTPEMRARDRGGKPVARRDSARSARAEIFHPDHRVASHAAAAPRFWPG